MLKNANVSSESPLYGALGLLYSTIKACPYKGKSMAATVQTLTIDINCPPALAAYLGQLLWTVGGVTGVMELYSNPNAAETTIDDLDVIRVFAEPADDVTEAITKLLTSDPQLAGCRIQDERHMAEADWAEHWKQYWHATRVTQHLTICPSWEREAYQSTDGERVMTIDPGSAFGTGAHGTTSLMLKVIETLAQRQDFSQCSVLDIGTGSGILAIACAMLGCQNITAIDICPNAVQVTKDNARLNGVESVINASEMPLADLCRTQHDIVLANIIAPVILALLPEMILRLAPNGTLVLSGLIAKNLPEIETALRHHGFNTIEPQQEGDWYALIARR